MEDWKQRYIQMKGDWPHPESWAGQDMQCHDYYLAERLQRIKNVMRALWHAKGKLPQAVRKETGEALDEIIGGILPGILMVFGIIALTTLAGVAIGAIGGAFAGAGIGAVPGAIAGGEAGFSAGVWILEWLGIGFLALHVGKKMNEVTSCITQGFSLAWGNSARDPFGLRASDMKPCHYRMPGTLEINLASEMFARSVAVLIRLVLEGIVLYLTAKGIQRLPKLVAQLKKSRFGEAFAVWVEKNYQKLLDNPKINKQLGRIGAEQNNVPNANAKNLRETPRTQPLINESQAAYRRALNGKEALPNTREFSAKTVASDGEKTISGWKQPVREGYSQATPEQVKANCEKIGHDLEPHPYDRDFPGQYNASHAEKQLSILRPNEPIGVSKPMCPDCQNYFSKLAQSRGVDQIVTDPNGTWMFRSDGTITSP